MIRGLKSRILEVEGLYYPCSENKGADQQRSYCAVDLRLCFCMWKSRFSHNEAQLSLIVSRNMYQMELELSEKLTITLFQHITEYM